MDASQPRLASRLREELKTTKRGKEIKHNLKDFYDLILLRVEQCAQWEDEEPSEAAPPPSAARPQASRSAGPPGQPASSPARLEAGPAAGLSGSEQAAPHAARAALVASRRRRIYGSRSSLGP
jgi:hypothetical protein